ncbi:TetR family transcriptional regulator [Saccharopolyspora flava]|uniref:Transcriptional regulator, TetR family n=1 Tax=Saccharopolyspora flava TaxID=95161 RepID=A0A1I6UF36_9PSEU|nr:TetR family transcriptional regulator [Saccharopolyspora flava]SFT00040.1 transcriptional regulator, TetR family [Saccharopolyspora flava]
MRPVHDDAQDPRRTSGLGARRLDVSRTAMRIFGEDGDTSAIVERIAAEAGVSARTFHRYFPAKEDVVRPVFERSAELTSAALRAAPRDGDPVDVLVDAMMALLDETQQRMTPQHQVFMQLVSELPELRLRWRETATTTQDAVREFLAGRIDADLDPRLQDLPSSLVVHAVHHVLELWLRGATPEELDPLLRRGLRTVFDGLRLRETGRGRRAG